MLRYLTPLLLVLCLSGVASAEDLDIYTALPYPANVLIVFDTSGSMSNNDVPGDVYDPGTLYAGPASGTTYPSNQVYYWKSSRWRKVPYLTTGNDLTDPKFNAPLIKKNLKKVGIVRGSMRYTGGQWHGGTGTTYWIATGNYLNFNATHSTTHTRLSVAKEAIKWWVGENKTRKVPLRIGLMRFDPQGRGGHLIAPCGTDEKVLVDKIDKLNADGYTPLAETLADAGRYFAGEKAWFDRDPKTYMPIEYNSPVQECPDKNFVIIMTDGKPTRDDDSKLKTRYIDGKYLKADASDNPLMPRLDDVANFLFTHDIVPEIPAYKEEQKRNIRTFTIGFKTDTLHNDLLIETARRGGNPDGLGFATADDLNSLKAVFNNIGDNIADGNGVYVAPVVPVSSANRAYSDNSSYIGFFRPDKGGRWFGNLKKYNLDDWGNLQDVDNLDATDENDLIKESASSYWLEHSQKPDVPDGREILRGGVGDVLAKALENGFNRKIYTYTGKTPLLTDSTNAFTTSNPDLKTTDNDLTDEVITSVRNGPSDEWPLGDIIHFEPIVADYGKTKQVFVGANDGMLHAFNDADGSEAWAFIPPDLLANLELQGDNDHDYFVDGRGTLMEIGPKDSRRKILLFGERRGGFLYHALDVTEADAPRYLYKIDSESMPDGLYLGQSWGKPRKGKVAVGDSVKDVFFLPGGYDTNQDIREAAKRKSTDSVGQLIFCVDALTGTPLAAPLFSSKTENLGMTHSMVDLTPIDHDGDGETTRIYAGDMAGQVFAMSNENDENTWKGYRLFAASKPDGAQLKIFDQPDVVEESFGEMVFFGTGDRTNPTEPLVENRFYAIKNVWDPDEAGLPLGEKQEDTLLPQNEKSTTDANLNMKVIDVTDDQIQMDPDGTVREAYKKALTRRKSNRGWFIRLDPGEKVVSPPIVFSDVVYFTTYSANADAGAAASKCKAAIDGASRMYALDYKTGAAVWNYSTDHVDIRKQDESGRYLDADGNVVANPEDAAIVRKGFHRNDRYQTLGSGLASAPGIAILRQDAVLLYGVSGDTTTSLKFKNMSVKRMDATAFYWRAPIPEPEEAP